jgi:hypothetical protein
MGSNCGHPRQPYGIRGSFTIWPPRETTDCPFRRERNTDKTDRRWRTPKTHFLTECNETRGFCRYQVLLPAAAVSRRMRQCKTPPGQILLYCTISSCGTIWSPLKDKVESGLYCAWSELIFDINIWRAACEACSATRNLGTNSAFAAVGPRKTTENLDRVGRSQDLPDANWLLASSQALINRTLMLVSICAVALFEKVYKFVLRRLFRACTLDEQRTIWYKKYTCLYTYIHISIYVQYIHIRRRSSSK